MEICEPPSLRRHATEVRRGGVFLPEAPDVAVAEVIAENNYCQEFAFAAVAPGMLRTWTGVGEGVVLYSFYSLGYSLRMRLIASFAVFMNVNGSVSGRFLAGSLYQDCTVNRSGNMPSWRS